MGNLFKSYNSQHGPSNRIFSDLMERGRWLYLLKGNWLCREFMLAWKWILLPLLRLARTLLSTPPLIFSNFLCLSIFLPNRLRFVAMCYRVTNPSGESEWPSASYSIFLVDFRRFLLEFATTLLQVGSSSDHIACNWYLFSSSWFHLKFVITWPNRVVFTDSSSYSPLSKSWSFLPTTRTSSRRSAFLVGSTARTRPRTRRRGRRRNRKRNTAYVEAAALLKLEYDSNKAIIQNHVANWVKLQNNRIKNDSESLWQGSEQRVLTPLVSTRRH